MRLIVATRICPTPADLAERITVLRDAFPEPQLMHVLFSEANDIAHEPAALSEMTHEHTDSAEFAEAPTAAAGEAASAIGEPAAPAEDEDAALLAALAALDQSAAEPAQEFVHGVSLAGLEAETPTPEIETETIVLGGDATAADDLTAAWVQEQLRTTRRASRDGVRRDPAGGRTVCRDFR